MDGGWSSWLPLLGDGNGIGKVLSRIGSEAMQQKQELPITSQVDEELQQFYLLMDMEETGTGHPAEPEVVPSSESSIFHSYPESPDETSWLMPRSSNDTTANKSWHQHHPAEVSSQQIQLDQLDDEFKCQGAHNERARAQHENHHGGAFVPYARHLSPKKNPKSAGSGGQRAIKAAMSALARMHTVRLAQWRQSYQMEVAPPSGSNCIRHKHILSERKRREKLNDSFKALRTVLPPASKKDKASTLIRARDYVSTLKSRVSELEEKNRMLLELQHRRNNGGGGRGDVSGEKVEVDIDINREACAVMETSQEFHLKIVVGSECSAMDAVVSILECLNKEMGDVRLVAMDTAGSGATTLTLQMKSRRWDDNILKEYVIKSVKGAMKSKIATC